MSGVLVHGFNVGQVRDTKKMVADEQPLACNPYGSHQSVFLSLKQFPVSQRFLQTALWKRRQNFDGSLILKYVALRKGKGPPISYLQFPLAVSCSCFSTINLFFFSSSSGFSLAALCQGLILEAQGSDHKVEETDFHSHLREVMWVPQTGCDV